MAYKIAQFNINRSLIGFPISREASLPNMFNVRMTLPTLNNKLIKKIGLDCIYNNSGDSVINYYALRLSLYNRDNIIIRPNNMRTVNSVGFPPNDIQIFLNKNNPVINTNFLGAGLNILGEGSLKFNSSGSPLINSVTFILSVYYVD